MTVLESQNHVSAKGSRSPPFLKNRLLTLETLETPKQPPRLKANSFRLSHALGELERIHLFILHLDLYLDPLREECANDIDLSAVNTCSLCPLNKKHFPYQKSVGLLYMLNFVVKFSELIVLSHVSHAASSVRIHMTIAIKSTAFSRLLIVVQLHRSAQSQQPYPTASHAAGSHPTCLDACNQSS